MRCSNCGGELVLKENIGVCNNCGSQLKIENAFENTEVCVCYLENDENGRRTKDSIIAGEVYKKLESKSISAFYEHISAANIAGDDLDTIRHTAIFHAKLIIIVGTAVANFSHLYEKFSKDFAGKKIIPLISGMKPEQLPNELKGYQVSNFDNVSALNDLSISVLNLLGRSAEVELEEIHNRKAKNKKILISVISSIIAALVCVGIVLGIVFRPKTEEKVLTDNDIYNNAIALLSEEKYFEAAAEFKKISNFKDSSNQIKKIYDRYDGYYYNELNSCSLYLNIIDSTTVEFSLEKKATNKIVKIEDSMTLENNAISGTVFDNLANEAVINIVLKNKTVELKTSSENSSELSVGNMEIQFQLENKSDRPIIEGITKATIEGWLTTTTLIEDIKTSGYDLNYIDEGDLGDSIVTKYEIENTDITILTSMYDIADYKKGLNTKLKGETVVAVYAPASIVCPDNIGKNSPLISNNGIIYAHLSGTIYYNNFKEDHTYEERVDNANKYLNITGTSCIGLSSKKILGTEYYNELIKSCEYEYYEAIVLKQVANIDLSKRKTDNNEEDIWVEINVESKNENYALVCVSEIHQFGYSIYSATPIRYDSYYKLDLSTLEIQLIKAFDKRSRYSPLIWENYPEYFSEFL